MHHNNDVGLSIAIQFGGGGGGQGPLIITWGGGGGGGTIAPVPPVPPPCLPLASQSSELTPHSLAG